jgi:hypothetical protein
MLDEVTGDDEETCLIDWQPGVEAMPLVICLFKMDQNGHQSNSLHW